jgi:hypothetical protein
MEGVEIGLRENLSRKELNPDLPLGIYYEAKLLQIMGFADLFYVFAALCYEVRM